MSNVRSLPECGCAVIRKKGCAAFKSGLTKYAAAMKWHELERTVGRWYAKFAELGIQAIHGSRRAPKPRDGKHRLSDLRLAEWKRIITDRAPDQLKFKSALWSSPAVKVLVSRKYGVQISAVPRADTCPLSSRAGQRCEAVLRKGRRRCCEHLRIAHFAAI